MITGIRIILENDVYWQYRTILFEFHKDGLLGDRYIDDEEVEKTLNEQGASGWELVNVTPIREGLLAFCKRPKKPSLRQQDDILDIPQRARVAKSKTPEVITAEQLKLKEEEHIRRLEIEQRKAIHRNKENSVGDIKIR